MNYAEEFENYLDTYREMLGFVPPRVQARFNKLGEENPELLLAQEKVRALVLDTPTLEEKTKQLILFAVLAAQFRDAVVTHGLAARRAGASWEELQATLDLVYLFGGVSVANHAPKILADIKAKEEQSS